MPSQRTCPHTRLRLHCPLHPASPERSPPILPLSTLNSASRTPIPPSGRCAGQLGTLPPSSGCPRLRQLAPREAHPVTLSLSAQSTPEASPDGFFPLWQTLGWGPETQDSPGPRPGSAEGRCGHTGDPSRGDPLRNGHEALLGCTAAAARGPTCTSRSAGSQTGMGLGHPSPTGCHTPSRRAPAGARGQATP